MSLLIHVAAFFVPLIGIVLIYPWIVRRSMRACPIVESDLRGQLDDLAARERMTVGDFVLWNTRGQLSNAALIGAIPWNRFVVLTDGLLNRLDMPGILALVKHEIAHAQRWHVAWRVLLVALPLWFWLWIQPVYPESLMPSFDFIRERLPRDARPDLAKFLIVPFLLVFGLRVALGRFSQLLEHDADLCACGFYDPAVNKAERRVAFLELKMALERIVPRPEQEHATWLHPSVKQRVSLIRSALDDANVATRIRNRGNSVAKILAIGFASAPVGALILACC